MIKVRNMKIYVKDKYSKWENSIQSFKCVCSEQIHSAQKKKKKKTYIYIGGIRENSKTPS